MRPPIVLVFTSSCVFIFPQCNNVRKERERGGNDDSRKRREGNTTEGGERVRESPREDQRTRGLTLNMEKDMFLSAIMRQTITWINK